MFDPKANISFSEGETVFVDPDQEPRPKDFVIATPNASGEATLKQLLVEGERRFLFALNPAWPEPLVEMKEGAEILGKVIYKGQSL